MMSNCLILGSGRSGTSLVTGIFARAGYRTGDNYINPRPSNPKGFFEDSRVNAINEELLSKVIPSRPRGFAGRFYRRRPRGGQRWLSRVDLDVTFRTSAEQVDDIQALVSDEPYCLKDPRFCFTLPAWRPFVREAKFVCVFREPGRTANSIVRECREARYLQDLHMTFRRAVSIWVNMYSHVLERHISEGEWLFLHYDQLFTDDGIGRLSDLAQVDLRSYADFADESLRRSPPREAGETAAQVYGRLCQLAGFS